MPPVWITEQLNGGQVTSRDRMSLREGELQQSVGCWYRPGDASRIHKQRGRTVFGDTSSAAKIDGLHLCQFDNAADKLVALSGTILYGATPGLSGSFTSLKTGLTTGAASLSATHYNDRWYLTNGLDALQVLEDDGSVRDAGMQAPPSGAPLTPGAGTGSKIRPSAPTETWPGGASATDWIYKPEWSVDTSDTSFAAIAAYSGGTFTGVWSGGAWTGASATRYLKIIWAYTGNDSVTTTFELDTGAGYTTIMSLTTSVPQAKQTFQYQVTSDPDDTKVRITHVHNGSGPTANLLEVYDVTLQVDSSATAVAADTTFIYAYAEYDATRDLTSPLSAVTSVTLLTASNHNQADMTLPASAENSTTTDWKIYRAPGGVTNTGQLGLVGSVPSSFTTFLDMFEEVGYAVQATPIANWIEQVADTGVIRYARDEPPLQMDRVFTFKGQLVGLKGRNIYYTPPGLPESWPTLYIIAGIPLQEHDNFKDGVDLGRVAILGATGAMLRVEDFPLVLSGQFVPGQAEQIRGAPGVVGPKALTAFSVAGESRAAWVSPYGVYVTDGYNTDRISDGIDWSVFDGIDQSDWTLHWDPDRFVLVMAYSTGSTVNRYAFFHMHPDHNGKVTWGSYGGIADLASGQVSNQRRLYSGHISDGKVYTEDQGGTDASNSYDASGSWPMVVQTRRIIGEGQEFAALASRLGHTDFGVNQEATIEWTIGRDISSYEETRTKTVSLAGHRREQFDIARGGEWHEVTITHTGAGQGALLDLQIQARSLGRVGKVAVR